MNNILSQILLAYLFVVPTLSQAQHNWISESGVSINSVDKRTLPKLDNYELLSRYASLNQEGGRLVFAEKVECKIDCIKNGTWESTDDGYLLWRQRISSEDAYSMSIAFESFHLPSTASLFLYDPSKTYVIGPINSEANDHHGQWWSPILPFDEVVIEVQLNEKDLNNLELVINSVQHDFSGVGGVFSGSCNLDVVCGAADGFPQSDRFRDIINSVGMYSINGTDLCTGALINTTRNDCTPYFLTADHCGVRNNNAASVVVYWNYQNSTCRIPGSQASGRLGDGSRMQFNSGSQLIASSSSTDFALLLLDDEVNPVYNPFYSGWDAESQEYDSTICIHHPNSEEKRISFDFDPATAFIDGFFIRVEDWDIGTTEGGSSGSPLYDQNKRIIGQLNGGEASCSNDLFDDFGSLMKAWEGEGTPQTRLKDWLDPDNTGQKIMDGRSCSNSLTVLPDILTFCTSSKRTDTITISVAAGFESGATISFDSLPDGVTINATELEVTRENPLEVEVVIDETIEIEQARFYVVVADQTSQISIPVSMLINNGNPLSPELTFPDDEATGVNFEVDFEWTQTGSGYRLELSTSSSFDSDLLIYENLTDNKIKINDLSPNTKYYWRVSSQNFCGFGDASDVWSFTTGNVVCQLHEAQDVPLIIGTSPTFVNSSIFIGDVGTVLDVNVIDIAGTHSWVSDLEFRLISPSNTVVTLISTACDDSDDFNMSFDDGADSDAIICPLTGRQTFKPLDPLSSFNGEEVSGTWTLEVVDDIELDGGSLDAWSLELCILPEQGRNVSLSPNRIDICQLNFEPFEISATAGVDFQGPIEISLVQGQQINESIDITPSQVIAGESFTISILDMDFVESMPMDQANLALTLSDDVGIDTFYIPIRVIRDSLEINLSAPAHMSERISLDPVFRWEASENTLFSNIRIYNSQDVTSPLIDTLVAQREFRPPNALLPETFYLWQVEVFGECSSEISEFFEFTTDVVTSVENTSLVNISVQPNPVEEYFHVFIPDEYKVGEVDIKIYSAQGILMKEINTDGESLIDASQLVPGVYLLEVHGNSSRWVTKIIKH